MFQRYFMHREFILFLIYGGSAASVNFLSRILYSRWLDYSNAVLLAYVTGMVIAFLLFKYCLFKSSSRSLKQSMLAFCMVNVLAILQTWMISMGLAYYVLPTLGLNQHKEEVAHGLGILAPAFSSYIGHKHWSFRH